MDEKERPLAVLRRWVREHGPDDTFRARGWAMAELITEIDGRLDSPELRAILLELQEGGALEDCWKYQATESDCDPDKPECGPCRARAQCEGHL